MGRREERLPRLWELPVPSPPPAKVALDTLVQGL